VRLRFVDVLRNRTFLSLYVAETQSTVGDQLARVALSVLVFERTGSPATTAAAYALSFLPAIAGGALLGGLADRHSRKVVIVCCDLIRGCLIAAMAIPGMPIDGQLAALALAVFLAPLFTSAEVSMIATALDADGYRVATGLRMITGQIAQAAGFAVGGVVVAAVHPRAALALDAATFVASAMIVGVLVRPERSTLDADRPRLRNRAHVSATVQAIRRDGRLQQLIALCLLAGLFVVPEGLAVPYAQEIGGTTLGVGVLMAAIPFGSVVGAYAVLRLISPGRRGSVVGPMAVLTGVPLVLCSMHPPMVWSIVLWVLSGVFAAYQLDVLTSIVQRLPPERRASGVGLIGSGLLCAQGLGVVAFGVLAVRVTPGVAIGVAGALGSVLALGPTIRLRRGAHSRVRAPHDYAPTAD
jgi:predicted MFS family arabinose efflux permease